jgi:hypothetical protein
LRKFKFSKRIRDVQRRVALLLSSELEDEKLEIVYALPAQVERARTRDEK